MNIGACFSFGKFGHQIWNCLELEVMEAGKPKENKPNIRAFFITHQETYDAKDVVACIIVINKIIVYIQFYFGVTIYKKFSFKLETFSEQLMVTTPARKTIQHISQIEGAMSASKTRNSSKIEFNST